MIILNGLTSSKLCGSHLLLIHRARSMQIKIKHNMFYAAQENNKYDTELE